MSGLVLLTTLRYCPAHSEPYPLLHYHTARLRNAWSHFAEPAQGEFPEELEERIIQQIYTSCKGLGQSSDWRVRVLLDLTTAGVKVEFYPMPSGSPPFQFNLEPFVLAKVQAGKPIVLDPLASALPVIPSHTAGTDPESFATDPADLYRYKTTERRGYEDAARRGKAVSTETQIFDTLLHWPREMAREDSTRNRITELTTSNIAIHCPSSAHHAQWITPRYHADGAPFLRGVMRAHLLSLDALREEDITVERFMQLVQEGRAVVGLNGLRGIWLANPILFPQE
ncbi:hypothetical protein NliqN6_3695 [Naganishia liquefaciens]|uniref:Aminodeoxychorismate lyase n=1 Tax=Naganishia liquefaciens TaxID=104408 RepID=A0A8H3YFH3_9TREE|nr:hypothetical protein NliqN6_3695 [Naganishia liquefaciens]